ncbi:ribonuclease domain-containing protein [Curvibacter sp. CHRR-16]|uniref:ribonuclease domain-containing protein n=1 Tax=Curvibacter sp. CHRR-16 TaxID=2835872 RepID=UPI002023A2A4|nr:ribonuclease domain-containing protein [Curvibacter sp. CHRR-16]
MGLYFACSPLVAKETAAPVASVSIASLPTPVSKTYQLVLQGGPFPFEKDGTVFFNRERLLPIKQRGYYREYTVIMNGNFSNRGTHRLVCGGPATRPDGCYYTKDHYASFKRIEP